MQATDRLVLLLGASLQLSAQLAWKSCQRVSQCASQASWHQCTPHSCRLLAAHRLGEGRQLSQATLMAQYSAHVAGHWLTMVPKDLPAPIGSTSCFSRLCGRAEAMSPAQPQPFKHWRQSGVQYWQAQWVIELI